MKSTNIKPLALACVRLLGKYSLQQLVPILAEYLVAHRMTAQVDQLLQEIRLELLHQQGHLEADVVTARQLSDTIMTEIKSFLKEKTKAKTIDLHQSIDPSLLGGAIITTPEWEIDLSLAHTLKQLEA